MLAEINIRTGHSDLAIEPLTRMLRTIQNKKRAAMLLATAYGAWIRPTMPQAVLQEGHVLHETIRTHMQRSA